MIITSCGNSEKIAKGIAKQLKAKYSPLTIGAFPDGDFYLRFHENLKGQEVVIVQGFQPSPDMSFFDVIFAGETARDLGAKRVVLVAPYLAYMRQDKRFHPGEAISSKIMGKHFSSTFDEVITIDPHLHRYKSLNEVFSCKTQCLTTNGLIGDWVKKRVRNAVIIGPDGESYQWAEVIAKHAGVECTVLHKTRFSSSHVAVKQLKPVEIKGKNVVIVDDIISTGHTIAEAAKLAKAQGAKTITAMCVHGLFADDALKIMKKAGVFKVVSTNTIGHSTNAIDVTELCVQALKK